ncbi:MAG: hypothetical protein M3O46_08700 [Myxococcota bacterium]|nr:hypothetical protein [Myxococcota bacterium]
MTDAPATLVWIAPEAPDAAQARSLTNWSRARGTRLRPPEEVTRALPVDPNVADNIENLLERARDGIVARDAGDSERALSSAESMLRAHPELPQAAWLMAEVERARAARWRHLEPADLAAAEDAWLRAEALDGGRAPGVGEDGSLRHPSTAVVSLDPLPEGVAPWLDGRLVRSDMVHADSGTHVLVLMWKIAPIWAAWIDVPPGRSTVHAGAVAVAECSAVDVAGARVTPDGIHARHVRCPRWVAATKGAEPGSVDVATCQTDRCGPLFEWSAPTPGWAWSPTVEPSRGHGLPSWATWTLVGAGAVIGAGAVLLSTGALQPASMEIRFASGGIQTR